MKLLFMVDKVGCVGFDLVFLCFYSFVLVCGGVTQLCWCFGWICYLLDF